MGNVDNSSVLHLQPLLSKTTHRELTFTFPECGSSIFQSGYVETASVLGAKDCPGMPDCPCQAGTAEALGTGAGFVSPDPKSNILVKGGSSDLPACRLGMC